MVILTDGLATAPDIEPEQYALAKAADLKATEVDVYAIGLPLPSTVSIDHDPRDLVAYLRDLLVAS